MRFWWYVKYSDCLMRYSWEKALARQESASSITALRFEKVICAESVILAGLVSLRDFFLARAEVMSVDIAKEDFAVNDPCCTCTQEDFLPCGGNFGREVGFAIVMLMLYNFVSALLILSGFREGASDPLSPLSLWMWSPNLVAWNLYPSWLVATAFAGSCRGHCCDGRQVCAILSSFCWSSLLCGATFLPLARLFVALPFVAIPMLCGPCLSD